MAKYDGGWLLLACWNRPELTLRVSLAHWTCLLKEAGVPPAVAYTAEQVAMAGRVGVHDERFRRLCECLMEAAEAGGQFIQVPAVDAFVDGWPLKVAEQTYYLVDNEESE